MQDRQHGSAVCVGMVTVVYIYPIIRPAVSIIVHARNCMHVLLCKHIRSDQRFFK